MRMKNIALLIACYLVVQPMTLAAQSFESGFAQALADSLKERREREFQRELLERQLEHEREMLQLRQAPVRQEPAVRNTDDGRRFVALNEIDFFGADLTQDGIRGVTLNTCVQICLDNQSCAAVSWVLTKSWCFPKRQGYTERINENVVSVEVR